MYSFVLFSHSIMRWIVLLLAVYLVLRSLMNWRGGRSWDGRLGKMFAGLVDLQVLLGVVLYVGLSPVMRIIFSDFGAAMQSSELRFFAIEHMPVMILAAVFAHLGSRVDKSERDDAGKWQRAALWFGLTLVSFLAGIPWFRPLLPF